MAEHIVELCREIRPLEMVLREAVCNRAYAGLCVMGGAGTVDEGAGEVAYASVAVVHSHPAAVAHVCYVSHFEVLLAAVALEFLPVFGFDHHGHSLLGFADGYLGGIQAAVFDRHLVQPYIQTVGELSDCNADSAGSEVVRLLDEAGHLRPSEEALYLSFFRGVTLLDFAAAALQRALVVLLGGTGGSAYAVTAGTASEHKNHVARGRGFPAYVLSLDGSDHRAYLQTLGRVAAVVYFLDEGGGQTYLVAVAGIALGRLLRDDSLREFARNGLGDLFPDVAGTGHAHRLIDVCTARERVAYGSAETGGGSSERLDFGRVVVGFVLELEQPFLDSAVHVHVNVYAAGIVFFADFEVIEYASGLERAGSYGGHIHKVQALAVASELFAELQVELQRAFYVFLDERLVHIYIRQLGGEGGVAAVVAPIGVEYLEFGLARIASFPAEVIHYLPEVIGVHRQAVALAEGCKRFSFHLTEAAQVLQGLYLGDLVFHEAAHILLAALHVVDAVFLYGFEFLRAYIVLEYDELGAAYAYVGIRLDEFHAVHCGRGPLVELSRQGLDCHVAAFLEFAAVRNVIRHHFSEHLVAAFLHKLRAESEQVIYIYQSEPCDSDLEILTKLFPKALRFYSEGGLLLNKQSCIHCYRRLLVYGGFEYLLGLLSAELFQLCSQFPVAQGQYGHSIKCRVLGSVDSHCRHRNARRHLHYRQQRIQTAHSLGPDRDPYDRNIGHCSDDSSEVCSSARTRDDDPNPIGGRIPGEICCQVRCAVSAYDSHLIFDAEILQGLDCG